MNLIKSWLFFLLCLLSLSLTAQTDTTKNNDAGGEYYSTITFDGKVIPVVIIDGDTLPTLSGPDIYVTRRHDFETRNDRKRYHQWRNYAAKVFPYALEAVRIYRQIQAETEDMKKGKKNKYTKGMEKNLKLKYEKELKALTKSQGYILIKMVERELGKPFYEVITTIRGGWEAVKWQTMASFYGYNLHKGYDPNDDPILETILSDLNLSYDYDMYDTDRKK